MKEVITSIHSRSTEPLLQFISETLRLVSCGSMLIIQNHVILMLGLMLSAFRVRQCYRQCNEDPEERNVYRVFEYVMSGSSKYVGTG